MFFRQHFGNLAIGLSNDDDILKNARKSFSEHRSETQHDFLSVDSGGISHPWSLKNRIDWRIQIAICGDNLIFDEEDFFGEKNPARLFARLDYAKQEVYLTHRYPQCLIGEGLPDPALMAREILEISGKCISGSDPHPKTQRWWFAIHLTVR